MNLFFKIRSSEKKWFSCSSTQIKFFLNRFSLENDIHLVQLRVQDLSLVSYSLSTLGRDS